MFDHYCCIYRTYCVYASSSFIVHRSSFIVHRSSFIIINNNIIIIVVVVVVIIIIITIIIMAIINYEYDIYIYYLCVWLCVCVCVRLCVHVIAPFLLTGLSLYMLCVCEISRCFLKIRAPKSLRFQRQRQRFFRSSSISSHAAKTLSRSPACP